MDTLLFAMRGATRMKRPLSGHERWCWTANRSSPNNTVGVCYLDAPYDRQLLLQAALLLQQRHPFLGVHIVADTDNENPCFVTDATAAPHLRHQMGADQASVRAAIEDEMNIAIGAEVAAPQRSPLFRCRVLTGTNSGEWVAMLTLAHVVSDATSVMLALRDWLALYSRLLAGTSTESVVTSMQQFPERPGIEALFPERFAGGFLSLHRIVKSQWLRAYRRLRMQPLRPMVEAQLICAERSNAMIHQELDRDQLNALQRACQQHDVTLHDAFIAALALAVRETLQGHGLAFSNAVEIGSSADLRRALIPMIGEEMGNYACTLPAFLNANPNTSFWELATRARREVALRVENQEHFSTLQLRSYFTPQAARRKRTPDNVCISNIGAFDMPRALGYVRVTCTYWAASLPAGDYLAVDVCSSLDSTHFNFVYPRPAVSEAMAEKISRLFRHRLLAQTASGSLTASALEASLRSARRRTPADLTQ